MYGLRPRGPRRTAVPCAPRRSGDQSHRPCAPRNRQTAARPPDGADASPATACLPTACKARRTGSSHSPPGDRRDIPPIAATASRPCGAARDGYAPSQAGTHGSKNRALSADRSVAQGPYRTSLAAAASSARHLERDPDSPEWWCAQSPSSPQLGGSTDPRLIAVKHLVSSASTISSSGFLRAKSPEGSQLQIASQHHLTEWPDAPE